MKFFTVALLVAGIAYAQAFANLSEEDKIKIEESKAGCIAESKVEEALVKKAFDDADFADDASLKAFYVCFFKKAEFINAEGKLDVEAIKTGLTKKVGEEITQKVLDNCTKDVYHDVTETAFNFAKCACKYVDKQKKH